MSFADDIMVYRQGRNRDEIANNLQEELDCIMAWCDVSGATINHTKAVLSWFSLNNHIVMSETPHVTFDGHTLIRKSSMSYLGIKFDRSLCFRDHIDHVIAKARNALSVLKIMAAANIEQRLLVILYQGLVL